MRKSKIIFGIIVLVMVAVLAACGNRDGNVNGNGNDNGVVDAPYNGGIIEEIIGEGFIPAEVVPAPPGEILRLIYPMHGYISMGYIQFMSDNLYNRTPFTYRELEAALWIAEELVALGHSADLVEIQEFTFEQIGNWTWFGWEVMEWMAGGKPVRADRTSQNVVLTVPGQSERKIIVVAHYDTVPYPGASDNASGSALLLESAARILNQNNYHTIVYVWVGAEEVGLLGAHFFNASLTDEQRENVIMIINSDVLFEGEHFIYGAGYQGMFGPGQNELTAQIDWIIEEAVFNHGLDVHRFPEAIFLPSDQLAFLDDGHTVVVFTGLHLEPLGSPGWNLFTYGDYFMTTRVLHSDMDCFHFINENFPGKMERAMHYFSVLLEELLLAVY